MAAVGDDCYFYFYSTCTKGKDCPFRHCELALGCEITCSLWLQGVCSRPNCKFRHMEIIYNRSRTPCYWENQPGGCRKPHCVFMHQKKGKVSETEKSENKGTLILPVSSEASTKPAAPLTSDSILESMKNGKSNSVAENLSLNSPPIARVVVNIGDNEESDTESTTGISSKLQNKISVVCSDVPRSNSPCNNDDFGIKTLEQLRMDKVIKESEHFYKPVYIPVLRVAKGPMLIEPKQKQNSPTLEWKQKTDTFIKNCCIVNSNEHSHIKKKATGNAFVPGYKELNDPLLYKMADSYQSSPSPGDLRDLIIKKRIVPSRSPSPPTKRRIVSLKAPTTELEDDLVPFVVHKVRSVVDRKSKENCIEDKFEEKIEKKIKHLKGSLDFRVKSLDEIRQEKEKRKYKLDVLKNADEDINEKKFVKLSVARHPKSVIKVHKKPLSVVSVISTTRQHKEIPSRIMQEKPLAISLQSSVHPVQKVKDKKPTRPIYVPNPKNKSSKKKSPSTTIFQDPEKMEEISPTKQSYLDLRSAFSTPNFNLSVNENIKMKEKTLDTSKFRKLKLNHLKIPHHSEYSNDDQKDLPTNVEVNAKKLSSVSDEELPSEFFRAKMHDDLAGDKHADSEDENSDLLLSLISSDMKDELHSESSKAQVLNNNDTYVNKNNVKDTNENSMSIVNVDSNVKLEINKNELDVKLVRNSAESILTPNRIRSQNSVTDDLDNLLSSECELNMDELEIKTTEKVDDIFSEIDQLLKS